MRDIDLTIEKNLAGEDYTLTVRILATPCAWEDGVVTDYAYEIEYVNLATSGVDLEPTERVQRIARYEIAFREATLDALLEKALDERDRFFMHMLAR